VKVSQVSQGTTSTLRLRVSADCPSDCTVQAEVRLQFPAHNDGVLLATPSAVVGVEACDSDALRQLAALRATDPARLCWIVAVQRDGKSTILTVQVHAFGSGLAWTGQFLLAVDDRICEQVAQQAGAGKTATEVSRWLGERVIIPPFLPGGLPRVIAAGFLGAEKHLVFLGDRCEVDIAYDRNGNAYVNRVAPRRGGNRLRRAVQHLVEVDIGFADGTVESGQRQSIRAQLDQILAETGSYVALWAKYQALERESLLRRARRVGFLRYRRWEQLPTGLWRFEIDNSMAIGAFRDGLEAADCRELEADDDVPSGLVESDPSEDSSDEERARAVVGTIERISATEREVLLRPLDEDSDSLPPKQGYLFAALHGDRRRLERRERAVMQIKSAEARMPQLALILEGRSAPVRRVARQDPLTAAAKKAFRGEPTPDQRNAIDIAVNTPDIVVIQGPPGTGKTQVIAAIAARLAELEAEQPELAGRTLLTSYQHDAVDNAVAKSTVFGLPAFRFGGPRGDRTAARDQIDRWRTTAREGVQAQLAGVGGNRPLAFYRSLRDQVASYASGAADCEQGRKLLQEALQLPAGTLSATLWDRVNSLLRTPVGAIEGDDLNLSLMRAAVTNLRVNPESFSDDGPTMARRAKSELDSILSQEEKDLLERAALSSGDGSFSDLAALSDLKATLLARLTPATASESPVSFEPDVLDALNGVISELRAALEAAEGGVADALQEYEQSLINEPDAVQEVLERYSGVYAATCQQAVSHHVVAAKTSEDMPLVFENVIVDEAARANPLDLFIPMSLARRRVILVGDHRQLPHLLDPDIEEAVSGSVREQEQHVLKQSLFEKLFTSLPQLQVDQPVARVVTLRDQFRMHPTLGQFVSDTFYAPHGEQFRSPRPASEFGHALPGYQKAGRPVFAAWKHLGQERGAEVSGRSKRRPCEAAWIAAEVKRLLNQGDSHLSLGVITFYLAQRNEILASLLNEGVAERDMDTGEIGIKQEYRTVQAEDGRLTERLRVGTVDSFQGKEFDVVFLSVTRSNELPAGTEEERRRKYGHLLLENRLCVAMSRQRRMLVAVGDREMFSTTAAREAVPGLARFLDLCGGDDAVVL
jgi:hypothetical protein